MGDSMLQKKRRSIGVRKDGGTGVEYRGNDPLPFERGGDNGATSALIHQYRK